METATATGDSVHEKHRDATLVAIALFKFAKGILLVAVGFGALKLLHHDVAETVLHWVDVLRVDPDNRFIHVLLSRLLAVSTKQLEVASVGTFAYAALLLTEGTGLWLRKTWANYFTIITTAGLIPLEVYEIIRRLSAAKVVVLLVNVAIVVYLMIRVRREREEREEPEGHSPPVPPA